MNIGVIIQARMGSSRLPMKVLKPFSIGKNILGIICDGVNRACSYPTLVATTVLPQDDLIEEFCKIHKYNFFRGSESDVLSRFTSIGDENQFDYAIRICADNPFLRFDSINELVNVATENPDADYVCYSLSDGTPTIKTHYGFWPELVKMSALKLVEQTTKDPIYHEHVTNYIYTHDDKFSIKRIYVPTAIESHKDIRMTVDTPTDFQMMSTIYESIIGNKDSYEFDELITFLETNKHLLTKMNDQIKLNSK